MRREYLFTGAILLLGAGLTCIEALRLRYYTPLGPGPGFFPFWLSLALGVCAIALMIEAVRKRTMETAGSVWPDRNGFGKILAVLASLVATLLLLEPLGYRMTMLGVYTFLLLTLGRRDYMIIGLVALAGSFGVYHLFVDLLQVPLPPGPFGH